MCFPYFNRMQFLVLWTVEATNNNELRLSEHSIYSAIHLALCVQSLPPLPYSISLSDCDTSHIAFPFEQYANSSKSILCYGSVLSCISSPTSPTMTSYWNQCVSATDRMPSSNPTDISYKVPVLLLAVSLTCLHIFYFRTLIENNIQRLMF